MGCSEPARGAAGPRSPAGESSAAGLSRGSPRCPRSPDSRPGSAAPSPAASSLSALSLEGASACGQAGMGRCPRALPGAVAAVADFWACAIPAAPSPRCDRRCPCWDPHRDYEELLDFAYPLRPPHRATPRPPLHDSGIDVGSPPASPARTWGGTGEPSNSFVASTPVSRRWGRGAVASRCEPPTAAEASWAESASAAAAPGVLVEPRWVRRPVAPGSSTADTRGLHGTGSSARRLLLPAQLLPRSRECNGDDEEFLSLPPRLGELQSLARYLSSLDVSVRPPARPERPWSVLSNGDGNGSWSVLSNGDSSGPWSTASGGDSEAPPREGLAQRVKAFCCQLQELIRWLRDVADTADRWLPPVCGAWSSVESMRRYVAFRQNVAEHRALARSVLHQGDALLECLAASSPALKDTLELVARQSAELERHVEQLHTAVLAPAHGEAAAARPVPVLPGHVMDA